jgi:hypothetical protein
MRLSRPHTLRFYRAQPKPRKHRSPSRHPLGYDGGMGIAISIFGIAYAAFCIWLTVRIVNRRERWAKRLAVGLALLLIAYPVSFGPACWITANPPSVSDASSRTGRLLAACYVFL